MSLGAFMTLPSAQNCCTSVNPCVFTKCVYIAINTTHDPLPSTHSCAVSVVNVTWFGGKFPFRPVHSFEKQDCRAQSLS